MLPRRRPSRCSEPMELAPGAAAAGVGLIACETVGSTNSEALAYARAGERGPLWITARAAQLSFVAALALHDAITTVAPTLAPRLALKWPNDVLCDGAKLAGILIEAEGTQPLVAAVGIGVNCRHHPAQTDFPATDLAAAGAAVTAEALFAELSLAMVCRLREWEAGFASIRADWLRRALGGDLQVRLGARELAGRFETLDESGRLMLRLPDGRLEAI